MRWRGWRRGHQLVLLLRKGDVRGTVVKPQKAEQEHQGKEQDFESPLASYSLAET